MPDIPNRLDLARRVEKAEKFLQKGKTQDALAEYFQILENDPENDSVRQTAADVCLSVNQTDRAVELLGELFEHQVAARDATRASLTYKKLARYTNPTWEQKVRFGQLLEYSNKKLAVGTYEHALEDVQRQGRKEESLLVLRRIVALEPTPQNHLRVAELSASLGEHAMASQAFLTLATLTEASGAAAHQYYERAYGENPSDWKAAIAYGKSLLSRNEAETAVSIFEPMVKVGDTPAELRDLYGQALVAAGRCTEAEPMVWHMFEQNPVRIHQVVNLIGKMIDDKLDAQALALARKLEAFQRCRGERRSFIATMQDLLASHAASTEMLEFLAELFNASNREADYAEALLKLFELYCAKHDYQKAGECLDRAAEVDPYEPGHQKRLEALRGKIADQRFNMIAARFSPLKKEEQQQTKTAEPTLGAAALQDLMLQAEILVQYGMRAKAVERLQRIQELFPGEEQHNQALQRLYISAGFDSPVAKHQPAAPPQPSTSPAPAAPAPATPTAGTSDVSSLARVAEITRLLYQQGNSESVLKTAAIEIGKTWGASRCVAALRKPGQPPSSVQEFHNDNLLPVSSVVLVSLVEALQDLAVARGAVTIQNAIRAPELIEVRSAVEEMQIESLLALPLADGADQIGVLIFVHNATRVWQPGEQLVIRALSDHIVIALNNVGLRRLVRNLSVTDEKSGLLKRASYLDLLEAETRRGLQQKSALSVMLMQFGRRSALLKEIGETGVSRLMEQIGQLVSANIRSNLAFRYDETTVALVLGEMGEKDAMQTVDKARGLLNDVRLPGTDKAVEVCAGLAEAVMQQQFDPIDIVTEVVNRADRALELAVEQGPGTVVCKAPEAASAAVA